MDTKKRFLDAMESDIMKADIPDVERNKLLKNFPAVRLDTLKSIQPIHQFAKSVLTHSCVC